MNKSRRMFTLLAQQLATYGVGTLIFDLYGTGDSAGDFGDARWDVWCRDVVQAVETVRERGAQEVHVLGLRMGALLALEVQRQGMATFDSVTLWSPMLNGSALMTQFLRLRLAASLMADGGHKETTKSLRERLASGEALEVAGYELAPELWADIEKLRLEPMLGSDAPPVQWLELVSGEGRAFPLGGQRVVEAWRAAGAKVHTKTVVGEPFWALQEITVAPGLLAKTVELFTGQVQ